MDPATACQEGTSTIRAGSIPGSDLQFSLAEGVGFEPTAPEGATVFKTAAII
jgi:hypothetical protein